MHNVSLRLEVDTHTSAKHCRKSEVHPVITTHTQMSLKDNLAVKTCLSEQSEVLLDSDLLLFALPLQSHVQSLLCLQPGVGAVDLQLFSTEEMTKSDNDKTCALCFFLHT